jgi:hypothetical protein
MNAESLKALAAKVKADLENHDTINRLTQLRDALRNTVNSPAEPSYQKSVAEYLQNVRQSLSDSAVNSMAPSERQRLEEMNILQCLGADLLEEIEDLFTRNSITPSVILDSVTAIVDANTQIYGELTSLVNTFDFLSIESDDLQPGECEVGVELPRQFVQSELAGLAKELHLLNRMIRPFQELATGARPPITVKALSTSWYTVLLDVDPATGAAFLRAVSWVMDRYESVLRMRKIAAELDDEGATELAENVRSEAGDALKGAIGEFTHSLVEDFAGSLRDGVNQVELEAELQVSVEGIAHRFDAGVRIQVRALPPVATVEQDDEGVAHELPIENGEAFDTIAQLAPRVRYMDLVGRPVFALDRPDSDSPNVDLGSEFSTHDQAAEPTSGAEG